MPDENRGSAPPEFGVSEGNQAQDSGTRGTQLERVGHEMPTLPGSCAVLLEVNDWQTTKYE